MRQSQHSTTNHIPEWGGIRSPPPRSRDSTRPFPVIQGETWKITLDHNQSCLLSPGMSWLDILLRCGTFDADIPASAMTPRSLNTQYYSTHVLRLPFTTSLKSESRNISIKLWPKRMVLTRQPREHLPGNVAAGEPTPPGRLILVTFSYVTNQ